MWSAAWRLGSLGKHVWLAVCVDAAIVVCIVCQSMLWLIYECLYKCSLCLGN